MIITKTPLRVSFFGGGTDFPAWYKEHGGAVLSTAINKYHYISIRKLPQFFDYKHRIVYSHIELVKTIDEIQHPSVRETFRYFAVRDGLEVHHQGDLPARSGLGSSSCFTVGLIRALKGMNGQLIDAKSLTDTAIEIEQNKIGESCGSQDQTVAAYGGFNRIDFNQDGSITVKPLVLPTARLDELQKGLCLFFTGTSRLADAIEKDKQANLNRNKSALLDIKDAVDEAEKLLTSKMFTLESFGRLLDKSWKAKQQLSKQVSSEKIDSIYEKAKFHNAYGGKILGAGGGGFILFVTEPWMRERLIQSLYPLVHVPFKFEAEGSRIALYTPNGL